MYIYFFNNFSSLILFNVEVEYSIFQKVRLEVYVGV